MRVKVVFLKQQYIEGSAVVDSFAISGITPIPFLNIKTNIKDYKDILSENLLLQNILLDLDAYFSRKMHQSMYHHPTKFGLKKRMFQCWTGHRIILIQIQ